MAPLTSSPAEVGGASSFLQVTRPRRTRSRSRRRIHTCTGTDRSNAMMPSSAGEGSIMAATRLRGLRAIRLSVLTDSTTSVDRQREAGNKSAAALDIDFGEGDDLREAVDLDVSALKFSPFNRPQLGKWLARPDEYDAIVWWRFDRAIASMTDMHDLAKWAKEHRKMLVFDEGVGNAGRLIFDFRNPMDPMAELMMMLFAFAAQVERLSTKERVTGAHAAIRQMKLRWKGGRPPYGYVPSRLESGGWTLRPDPDAVAVIQRAIRELKGENSTTRKGKSATAIAVGLTNDEIPTPWQYWAARRQAFRDAETAQSDEPEDTAEDAQDDESDGKAPSRGWSGVAVKDILTGHAMLGWKVYKGQIVRDPVSGAPVPFTDEPILTRTEFDHIGEIFAEKSRQTVERKDTNALLLGVLHCDACGARMYLQKRTTAENYACKHYNTPVGHCPAPSSIKREWAEDYVEREFLRRLGGVRVLEHERIPGYDPAPEIEETEAEFKAHLAERGKQKSRAAIAAWQERHDSLDARLGELEARPKTEARTVVKEQSMTYAQMWAAGDVQERRALLMDCGVYVPVKKAVRGGWRTLDPRRVSFEVKAEFLSDPEKAEFLADAADELEALADELST